MKILFVSHSSPFLEGGVETRSRETALRLAAEGHEVKYLCGKMRPEELPFERKGGIEILRKKVVPDFLLKRFPFPSYFTLAMANVLMMFHLLHLLREERFDALREDFAPVPVSGLLAFFPLPVGRRVAVVHNLPGNWSAWVRFYGAIFGGYGRVMEFFLRRGWFQFDRYVVPSRWYWKSLERASKIFRKAHFIPNGIDESLFVRHEHESRAAVSMRRLVCVGRAVEVKGHRDLLEAMGRLKPEFPEMRLTLVAQGSLLSSLMREAEALGIRENIEFVPCLAHDEMPALFRRSGLLVMPSRFEGFSLVLLEAMACGLPTLLSDIPGFRDIADGNTSVFFKEGNGLDLAAKLRWAFENPEEMREKARRGPAAVAKYRWETICSKEVSVLLGLDEEISSGEFSFHPS